MVPLVVTIRTADRSPKRNYLGATVRSFLRQGCDPGMIHLYPTHPDVRWLSEELHDVAVPIHAPETPLTPNANGLAQLSILQSCEAEWVALCEDDLDVCADIMGSLTRWLRDHAEPTLHVYRAFALPGTSLRPYRAAAALFPLREMRGSQAVLLRAEDARALSIWAATHATDWRPKDAPFQDHPPTRGFDKLIGYWALATWPSQPYGVVSVPMMVRHVGRESSLYSHGLTDDRAFAGSEWRYFGTGTTQILHGSERVVRHGTH